MAMFLLSKSTSEENYELYFNVINTKLQYLFVTWSVQFFICVIISL
jgi:hypothetical protein